MATRTPTFASSKPKPARRPGGPSALPQQVHSVAQQADGILMGLIGYAIAINYVRNGWTGVKDWGKAKFFNQPTQGAEGVVTGPTVGTLKGTTTTKTKGTSRAE